MDTDFSAQNGPSRSTDRLADWLVNTVLPYWLRVAHDGRRGHFHEGLGLDGGPLQSPVLRTRTAARMIHVFADAARLGVGPAGGLDAARAASDALERDALLPGGLYGRAIDRIAGTILDPVRDLYDQSCVLLAHAALLRCTGEALYRERAERLLQAIDRLLPAGHGGWAEDELGSLPRRQNPHMHLFEALFVLAEATGDDAHVQRLRRCGALLRERFLHDGVLREYFGPDWSLDAEWGSERLDPGHMAEWAFLLRSARALIGTEHDAVADGLMEAALRLGTDARAPLFLLDEVDTSGRPLSDGRRLWLQLEQIKGCLLTGRATRAEEVAAAVLSDYVGRSPAGIWCDRFGLDGAPIATIVPASSCYHAWTVVAVLLGEGAAGRPG